MKSPEKKTQRPAAEIQLANAKSTAVVSANALSPTAISANALSPTASSPGSFSSEGTQPGVLFQFTAVMGQKKALVKPKFTESAIKVNMPTLSCDFLCCCRNGMTHSVISRHKLLSYDFTSDEWNFGSCTGLCKCVCCLTDKKSLSIMTSDKMLSGLPVYLDFFTDPSNSSTVFPAELPGQIKNYIFSPLNGIADNAQLISHMKKDGIIDKMSMKFKLSDKVSFAAAPMQEALFDVKMGTKGKGQFSAAKFYPSYIDMVYGSNAKCCGGLLTHPCLIQSHEMVIPKFQVTGYETSETDLCWGCCCCFNCKSNQIKITTSQSSRIDLGPCGKLEIPTTYELPFGSDAGFDQLALESYVYGSVQSMSTELHATNHLLAAGLTEQLAVSEELKSFLSPSADAIERDGGGISGTKI